jgi:LDH2 family malate/lactate/ureidoglycolate dehydrogenase
MPSTSPLRIRLDRLRSLAVDLLAAAGLDPTRAAELANLLLWYDTAGFPAQGIAALPGWLDRLAGGTLRPGAEGQVQRPEHAATAVVDGQGGVPPLVLARCARIASEKARDTGVGLVRLHHLGPVGPVAAIAAELALGPFVALVVGPELQWCLAVPGPDGLPLVYDTALVGPATPASQLPSVAAMLPFGAALLPDGGWLVLVAAVASLEPLTSLHERVRLALAGPIHAPGVLDPAAWEEHRRLVREQGVVVDPAVAQALDAHATRLGVARRISGGG